MPEKDIRRVAGKDYPKVNTFTAASARRLSELTLTPPEMYPAEAAEYLDSDLVTGLDRRQVRQRRAKYGDNTETGMPIGFVKSLERQLKNLPNVLLMGSLIMFYAFRGGAFAAPEDDVEPGIVALPLAHAEEPVRAGAGKDSRGVEGVCQGAALFGVVDLPADAGIVNIRVERRLQRVFVPVLDVASTAW
ncbi:MAG: hypothetical protein J6W93_07875 [Clostridia bacterium]|nr:hypothetical protein [Clostridia bacterium]